MEAKSSLLSSQGPTRPYPEPGQPSTRPSILFLTPECTVHDQNMRRFMKFTVNLQLTWQNGKRVKFERKLRQNCLTCSTIIVDSLWFSLNRAR